MIIRIVDQDTEHNAAKKLMRITEGIRTLPLQQLHQLQVACPWIAITSLGKRHRGYKSPPASACSAIESLNQKCRWVAGIQQSRRRQMDAALRSQPVRQHLPRGHIPCIRAAGKFRNTKMSRLI